MLPSKATAIFKQAHFSCITKWQRCHRCLFSSPFLLCSVLLFLPPQLRSAFLSLLCACGNFFFLVGGHLICSIFPDLQRVKATSVKDSPWTSPVTAIEPPLEAAVASAACQVAGETRRLWALADLRLRLRDQVKGGAHAASAPGRPFCLSPA